MENGESHDQQEGIHPSIVASRTSGTGLTGFKMVGAWLSGVPFCTPLHSLRKNAFAYVLRPTVMRLRTENY